MVSFDAAIHAGVDMIELDITLSRDSEMVVIHDDTLDRTTNGSGPVERHTWAALQKLDAGGWFHKKFAGERVPNLDQVLDAFVDKVMINIEIKPNVTGSNSYVGAIVEKTLAAVHAKNGIHRVLISSFDPEILSTVAGCNHPPALALLLEEAIEETSLTFAENLGAVSIHPDMDTLNIETVHRIRARDFLVFPYNLGSEKTVCRGLEMGVDGFFVDDPLMAITCCHVAKTRL
jgi:glycerophosphoryl diester phosphodiesterase